MYLLPSFFSSLGQQHFSVIMALIQQEILITFANFIANQCKQIQVCVTVGKRPEDPFPCVCEGVCPWQSPNIVNDSDYAAGHESY